MKKKHVENENHKSKLDPFWKKAFNVKTYLTMTLELSKITVFYQKS